MTIKKIRDVVSMLVEGLARRGIPQQRIGENYHFKIPRATQRKMLAHAHYLLSQSLKEDLLKDKRRLRSRSGHGKIGRHLGAAQGFLIAAGMYSLGEAMNHNKKDKPPKKKKL